MCNCGIATMKLPLRLPRRGTKRRNPGTFHFGFSSVLNKYWRNIK